MENSPANTPNIDTASFSGNLDDSANSIQALARAVDNLPLGIADSAADSVYYGRRNGAWTNLKTYFDTLYQAVGSYLTDAASDSVYYGRYNGAWTNLKTYFDTLYQAAGSYLTDAASDSIYYGRYNGAWTNLKTYFDTLYAAYTTGTTSRGFSKSLNDSISQSYLEQVFDIKRTIKVKEVTVDIYEASDYTLSIRDYEGNVIVSKAETGLTLNSTKVFNMSDTVLVPGLYRIRLTPAANKRYALKSAADYIFSDLSITGGVFIGASQYGGYKAPFILTFYTKTT